MLTYIQINAAKPAAKARALSDSQGLYLVVQPNGSKLWRFRYRFLDRQKTLHLGGWPQISLADARLRRDDAKKLVANGIDPALEKKRARIAAKHAAANTFEAVARDICSPSQRSRRLVRRTPKPLPIGDPISTRHRAASAFPAPGVKR